MLIHLHKQATTVSHYAPLVQAQWRTKVRAVIQASDDTGTALAERFGDEADQRTIQ